MVRIEFKLKKKGIFLKMLNKREIIVEILRDYVEPLEPGIRIDISFQCWRSHPGFPPLEHWVLELWFLLLCPLLTQEFSPEVQQSPRS